MRTLEWQQICNGGKNIEFVLMLFLCDLTVMWLSNHCQMLINQLIHNIGYIESGIKKNRTEFLICMLKISRIEALKTALLR